MPLSHNQDVNGAADVPTTHEKFSDLLQDQTFAAVLEDLPDSGQSLMRKFGKQHEDDKKALIVDGVIKYLVILWLRAGYSPGSKNGIQ